MNIRHKFPRIASLAFWALAIMMLATAPLQAQLSRKESRRMAKQLEKEEKSLSKEIRRKAERNARKEASRLEKEGFLVFPGSVPMAKQLENSWMMQYATTEEGFSKYLFSDGNGVGKTQTAAEMQAMEAAKLQLAGQISNELNQIIEAKIANEQIDRVEGQSLTKFVAGSKNYIIQHLAFVKPGFKVYRESGKRDMEVQIKLFYSADEAMKQTQKALEARARAELETEADELIEEINGLFRK